MFDLLIQNVMVADGSGEKAFLGDIALDKGKILKTAPHLDADNAGRVLDARELWAAPGFIDIHRHADGAVFRSGFGEGELFQGLTTIVSGNCGMSAAPLLSQKQSIVEQNQQAVIGSLPKEADCTSMKTYLSSVRRHGTPLHFEMLCGLGTLLAQYGGYAPGDKAPLLPVQKALEQALSEGALGVSMGIGYAPEFHYTLEELLTYLAPLKNSGLPVTVHMRQEGDGMVDGIKEAIALCRRLHTPVEVSHLKAIGKKNWHKSVKKALLLLRQAREEGLPIYQDVYPYTAGSTQLMHVLPPEEDWRDFLRAETKERIARRIETGTDFENILRLCGYENVLVGAVGNPALKQWEGLSLSEAAQKAGKEPLDFLLRLLHKDEGRTAMVDFITCEEDIEEILRDEETCLISDAIYPASGCPHPRVAGAFVRMLEEYVEKRRVLSREEAIRRMTSLPANRMRLGDRGRIAPGCRGDLVLFRPESVRDTGAYNRPLSLAEGVEYVFVDGRPAIWQGRFYP